MHEDLPIEHVIHLVRSMRSDGVAVIVLTARNEEVRPQTEAWLAEHNIEYDALFMRADNDYRKDEIVKGEITREILNYGYHVLFALEDRNHNVAMFRAMGVPCLQVVEDEETRDRPMDWNGQTFLTMMIGPSGAGKSTYTKANFTPDQIISSDDIREQLTGWDRSTPALAESTWKTITNSDHSRVWRAVHDLVETRLRNGLKTCVDATNIQRKDRMEILKHVPATQRVRYVIVDRPLPEKLLSRGWRSEELVRKHHMSFDASKKHALKGDDQDFVDVVCSIS